MRGDCRERQGEWGEDTRPPWLAVYLVVYPRAGIVAVRQRREPPNVTDDDNKKIGMRSFTDLVRAALPADTP